MVLSTQADSLEKSSKLRIFRQYDPEAAAVSESIANWILDTDIMWISRKPTSQSAFSFSSDRKFIRRKPVVKSKFTQALFKYNLEVAYLYLTFYSTRHTFIWQLELLVTFKILHTG